MADIRVRQTLSGDYKGTVPGLSLSFTDRALLSNLGASASAEARETQRTIGALGSDIAAVEDAIGSLERDTCLRLDAMTDELGRQTKLLLEIRDATLTPNRVRGAERASDAIQLLSRERFERALQVANDGIEADPNNATVFFAAGWAYVGLDKTNEAQKMFEEARDAADGDECSRAARQAARVALIAGRTKAAYDLVRDARAVVKSDRERAALNYDIAICAWVNDEAETAEEALRAASEYDTRFCQTALVDEAFRNAQPLLDAAAEVLTKWRNRVEEERSTVAVRIKEVEEAIPPAPQLGRSYYELGESLRPAADAAASHWALRAEIETAREATASANGADSLQQASARLDDARATADEAEALIPKVIAETAEHERADARHGHLAAKRAKADQSKESAERVSKRLAALRRFKRHWFLIGLVLVGISLLSGVATLAIILVALWLIGMLVLQMSEGWAQSASRASREVGSQLSVGHDAGDDGATEGIRHARAGAYRAAIPALESEARIAANAGDARGELQARLWLARTLIDVESYSAAAEEAELAVTLARLSEDYKAEERARRFVVKAAARAHGPAL